jgi:hypothetical protein
MDMAQNVVGTFATMRDAESAVQALRDIGITDDEMTVVPHTSDAEDAEATTALAQSAVATAEVEGRPVPEAVAEVAAHGPKRSGGYIIVRVGSDEAAAHATEIMERYKAVDLESRSQQYAPGEWTHVDDAAAMTTGDTAAVESMTIDPTAETTIDSSTLSTGSPDTSMSTAHDEGLVNPITADTTAEPGTDAVIPSLTTTRRAQVYGTSSLSTRSAAVPVTSDIADTTAPPPDLQVSLPVAPAPSPTMGVTTSPATTWNNAGGLSQQLEPASERGLLAFLQHPLATLLIGVALGFGLARLFNKERDA